MTTAPRELTVDELDYLDKMAQNYGKQPSDGWVIGYDEWAMVSAAARRAVGVKRERDEWKTLAIKAEDDLAALRAERDKLVQPHWESHDAIRGMHASIPAAGDDELAVRSEVKRLRAALRQIANQDYRGNRCSCVSIAEAALETA